MRSLPPVISSLPPTLGYAAGNAAEQSRYRRSTQPWQQWYKTERWRRLRWSVLVRDLFTCAMCKRVITGKGEAICDHVQPHRGDIRLFWSGPFQTLCKGCHDKGKQRDELALERGARP